MAKDINELRVFLMDCQPAFRRVNCLQNSRIELQEVKYCDNTDACTVRFNVLSKHVLDPFYIDCSVDPQDSLENILHAVLHSIEVYTFKLNKIFIELERSQPEDIQSWFIHRDDEDDCFFGCVVRDSVRKFMSSRTVAFNLRDVLQDVILVPKLLDCMKHCILQ